jgi:hypothetical protein
VRNKILPASRAKLRVHGNGFLQAETRCGNKFHVWDTRLPQQKVQTFKHNHNHGFESTLLIGDLMWKEFEIIHNVHPQSPIYLYTPHQCIPRKGKDTRLEPSGSTVGLTIPREFFLKEGSSYTWLLNMNLYHEVNSASESSSPLQTITFIERREYCDDIPTVLVPRGTQPDNGFDRYAFEEIAVQVYEEAMRAIR